MNDFSRRGGAHKYVVHLVLLWRQTVVVARRRRCGRGRHFFLPSVVRPFIYITFHAIVDDGMNHTQ